MSYPPYPEYGDPAPDWLGSLPRHWTFRRLRFAVSEPLMYGANEAAVLDDRALPRYIRITDVKADGTLDDDTFRSLDEDVAAPYLLKDGDILLARSGATVGKSFQYLANWGRAAYAGYLIRCRLDSTIMFPRFANYYFQTECYWACIRATLIQATIENFSAEKYKDLTFPLPPKDEQQKIAAFLDWKTGQIDALISRKAELLEKLKEKRIAVITQAVTQGLNPAAPMRDSGVPWLGQVPQHWEVKRIKFIGRVGNGSTPSRENSLYWDEGDYPWLNSSVVNQEAVTMADQFVTAEALAECHLPIVQPPAVLIGITGEGKTRGMATTLLFEATINQHLAYLKPDPSEAVVGFVRRVFDMAYPYLRSESDGGGSTKGAITCEQITELSIPVPPIAEQETIATYLGAETLRIDRLVEKVESAIDRLTEYRTALITAATTGQTDVREVQIPAKKPV